MNYLHFEINLHFFFDFVACLCHTLLLITMPCQLLGGEFSKFSCFDQTWIDIMDFVACFCHVFFLVFMHLGSLDGEFNDVHV